MKDPFKVKISQVHGKSGHSTLLNRQLYDRQNSSGRTGRCEDEVCWSNVLPADTWCSHAITCQEQLSFQPKVTHTQTEREREVRRKERVSEDTRG